MTELTVATYSGAGFTSSFTYDAEGIRTSKTCLGKTYTYITQNGKVVRETMRPNGTVSTVKNFIYDESGRPFAMIYKNGTAAAVTYYYVLNLQGDVVGLINQTGTIAASYTYDAWGNMTTYTGSMVTANPLRYRGYYCDYETGLYYLQSRYYDPATHRFINADSYASTGQGFVGTNMFAYCINNPANHEDNTGAVAGSLTTTTRICDGGSRYYYVDTNGINHSELNRLIDQMYGRELPWNTPYAHAKIEYAGELYWNNNTDKKDKKEAGFGILATAVGHFVTTIGYIPAGIAFVDLAIPDGRCPNTGFYDAYKVTIDVYIAGYMESGMERREYIYIWCKNSPVEQFWYQVSASYIKSR